MMYQLSFDSPQYKIIRYYEQIESQIKKGEEISQKDRVFYIICKNSLNGRKVPLPELLAMFIAGYRSRITELRQEGIDIRCEEISVNGQKHSVYWIVGI